MTDMLPEPVVTLDGEFWQGAWTNAYTVRQLSVHIPRPTSYVALIEALYHGQSVLTQAVDLLDFHSKERFGMPMAARNGTSTVVWEVFLSDFYHNLMLTLAAQQQHHCAGTQAPLMPPLPACAQLDAADGDGAAPWLDAYITHSTTWSPRAARHYHAAVGLWMLSTIAAGRIAVEMGDLIYPNLFLALVSRSTLFAKTTTAKIGRAGLRQAECGPLLAADRATPQALLRTMAGTIPATFGDLSPEEQTAFTERLAFAGQRGWYYEEWGSMLHQMTRKDSPTAEFHALLRWMDDGTEQFESETIARGAEHVTAPYLALLCSATPHDLAAFMRPGAPYWHDGFWPRFAFITPLQGETASHDPLPAGRAVLPERLLTPLKNWHYRLGIPRGRVTEVLKKGKPTGRYTKTVETVPVRRLTLSPDTLHAYQAYNTALVTMITQGEVSQDLDACYGRFHMKALRIAMLLASISESSRIELPHWIYAQTITEQWRLMLHQLIEAADAAGPLTREEILEMKIERKLAERGALTARQLAQSIWGAGSRDIVATLQAMLRVDRVALVTQGKKDLYSLPTDVATEEHGQEDTITEAVPF
jgi:hypothetical protein